MASNRNSSAQLGSRPSSRASRAASAGPKLSPRARNAGCPPAPPRRSAASGTEDPVEDGIHVPQRVVEIEAAVQALAGKPPRHFGRCRQILAEALSAVERAHG